MVDVAQLVESRIVIPVVVGSSPIVHPIKSITYQSPEFFWKINSKILEDDSQKSRQNVLAFLLVFHYKCG